MAKMVFTVFDMSKIQFWKQFTTISCIMTGRMPLYSICQRYNFESNLQRIEEPNLFSLTVFDMSKIQFWKQFTTSQLVYRFTWNCIRYVKDTILKAIYNILTTNTLYMRTVFDMSKIQFWKQFTTTPQIYRLLCNCIRYVKDTILKAIYNLPLEKEIYTFTVFDMSKIQFWKQFTTALSLHCPNP